MLDQVEAVRFIREMNSGRNNPLLVEVERDNGDYEEVVAKLSASECGVPGLIREAFSSMLAADLNLPIPEPVLVNFPEEFSLAMLGGSPETELRISKSVSPSFGSVFKSSLHVVTSSSQIPSDLFGKAAEIIIFDGICLNVDRKRSKPNCLTNEVDSLFIIDHELAFADIEIVGSLISPPPWKVGGMNYMADAGHEHVLLKFVKGKKFGFEEFEAKWREITPMRIDSYVNAIPVSWRGGRSEVKIASYLNEVIKNLDHIFIEAKRLLS